MKIRQDVREVAINGMVILAALTSSVTLIRHHAMNEAVQSALTSGPYPAGYTFPFDEEHSDGSPAIYLILRSNCRFCADSLPFYRRLTEQDRASGVHTVALVLETKPIGEAYLKRNGVEVDSVSALRQGQLERVNSVPSLILVDSKRRVVRSWAGFLPEQLQRDVFMAIKSVSRTKRVILPLD